LLGMQWRNAYDASKLFLDRYLIPPLCYLDHIKYTQPTRVVHFQYHPPSMLILQNAAIEPVMSKV
jgi:hypothetical protein